MTDEKFTLQTPMTNFTKIRREEDATPRLAQRMDRDQIGRILYECEKRRAEHCQSVMQKASGKECPGAAMEPWDECSYVFLSDADAVLAALSGNAGAQQEISDLKHDVERQVDITTSLVNAGEVEACPSCFEGVLKCRGCGSEFDSEQSAAPSPAVLDPVTVEAISQILREKIRIRLIEEDGELISARVSEGNIEECAEAIRALIGQTRNAETVACACDTDHPLFKERGHHPHCPLYASPSNPQETVRCQRCGSGDAMILCEGCWSPLSSTVQTDVKIPKVRTSHHRNKEEAARLQKLVAERVTSNDEAKK
jgi:hypothetical protein